MCADEHAIMAAKVSRITAIYLLASLSDNRLAVFLQKWINQTLRIIYSTSGVPSTLPC